MSNPRPVCWKPSGVLFLLSAAFLLVGCVSTQDRYEKAQELTNEKRYAEAARYYVRVLREEPDWPNARDELQPVAQRAVDRWLDEADAAAAGGRYETAVALLDDLDALRADVESVGVPLAMPDNYAAYRREAMRAAADMLIAEGGQAEEGSDWPAAADAYERARQYVQSEQRQLQIDEAQARVALRWSEDEMARGHFQAAYLQADRVFDLVRPEHAWAADAETLQAEAVEHGTRAVAFLPLGSTEKAAAPDYFLADLNDVLQYDHWSAPPLFIAPVDFVEARRMLRRMRLHRAVLATFDAANVGRLLEADFVVVGELATFVRAEANLEEEGHPARMRVRGATGRGAAWRDTSYVLQTFDLVLEAAVDYRIVAPHTRRVIDDGVVREHREVARQRGIFQGDHRRLDLTGSEIDLFDREAHRAAERELENQLIDRLAAHLADDVFNQVLRHIE